MAPTQQLPSTRVTLRSIKSQSKEDMQTSVSCLPDRLREQGVVLCEVLTRQLALAFSCLADSVRTANKSLGLPLFVVQFSPLRLMPVEQLLSFAFCCTSGDFSCA